MLLSENYKNISVGEMHLNGLKCVKTYGLKDLCQFDLLKEPFIKHFDVVCLFDVLEHIEHDNFALKNVSKILVEGGRVVITVPAHKWLWSNVDFNSGHKRRYSGKMIKELSENNGFKVLFISHFFTFIISFLYIRKLMNKKDL